MRAVIVANGDAAPVDRTIAAGADLLIAADGGALLCSRWGLLPQLVVGDLDSLGADHGEDLARRGTRVVAYPSDKDESDTELAVGIALERGAHEIVLLAALGGDRLDHAVANLLLVASPELGGRLSAVRGNTTVRALHGGARLVLAGRAGDLVTLLPVGDARGVVTDGLRYPLNDAPLTAGAARGLSNVIERTPASVAIGGGVLLVIEIAADMAEGDHS